LAQATPLTTGGNTLNAASTLGSTISLSMANSTPIVAGVSDVFSIIIFYVVQN
jgi:hypothetical protein